MGSVNPNNRFEKAFRKLQKKCKPIKDVFTLLLIVIFLFVLLELVSFLVVKTVHISSGGYYEYRYAHLLEGDVYKDAEWAQAYLEELDAVGFEYYPYLSYRSKPHFEGEYVVTDSEGRRMTHNSCGAGSTIKIFMMGGSTMWGVGSRNEHTIPSQLSRLLCGEGIDAGIINFGERGYTNTQELIQLVLELRKENIPSYVVFYDGVNEVYSAFQGFGVGYPQNMFDRKAEFGLNHQFNILTPLIKKSYFNRLIMQLMSSFSVSKDDHSPVIGDENLPTEVVRVYIQNLNIIQSLSDAHNTTPIFIWQPNVFTKDMLSENEKRIVARESKSLRQLYVDTYEQMRMTSDLPQHFYNMENVFDHLEQTMYSDFSHISEKGNEMIAVEMAKLILSDFGYPLDWEPSQSLCLGLGEEECFNSEKCRGTYGPSHCSGGICTEDIEFKSCQKIPMAALEQVEQEKVFCQNTNGEWKAGRFDKLGRCECQQSYFRSGEGCMSMEDDCQKFGGTIYEPGTLECDDHLREIDPFTCRRDSRYNAFKECVCLSGKTWDFKNRCS